VKVKVDGVSLNYELTGQGKTITLIHGMGDNLHLWDNQVPVFSKKYQVLRFDTRGFGKSDVPREGYPAEALPQDVYGLLRALNIKETHLAGFSMGGVIALRFALDYPQMVKALIVVSSSSQVNPQAIDRYEQRARAAEQEGIQAIATDLERRFYPGFLQKSPDFLNKYRQQFLTNDPRGWAMAARSMARYNYTEELARIKCPTLVIVGENDVSVGVGGSVIISRRIPGSQLKIVKECGHDIAREKPEEFNGTVLEFLASVR